MQSPVMPYEETVMNDVVKDSCNGCSIYNSLSYTTCTCISHVENRYLQLLSQFCGQALLS